MSKVKGGLYKYLSDVRHCGMDRTFLDILIWQPVVKRQQLLQSSPRSDRQVELQAVLTSTYYLMSQYDQLVACAA